MDATLWWILGAVGLSAGLVLLVVFVYVPSLTPREKEQPKRKTETPPARLHQHRRFNDDLAWRTETRTILEHRFPETTSLPDLPEHFERIEEMLQQATESLRATTAPRTTQGTMHVSLESGDNSAVAQEIRRILNAPDNSELIALLKKASEGPKPAAQPKPAPTWHERLLADDEEN